MSWSTGALNPCVLKTGTTASRISACRSAESLEAPRPRLVVSRLTPRTVVTIVIMSRTIVIIPPSGGARAAALRLEHDAGSRLVRLGQLPLLRRHRLPRMHAAIATGLIAAAAPCLVACGGSVSSARAGRPDATASDAGSAEDPDAPSGLMEASSVLAEAGFADADVIHRGAGSMCPTARGAGAISCPDMGGGSCTSNADCDAGVNGRCLRASNPLPCGGAVSCSYDECFMDSDCPAVP